MMVSTGNEDHRAQAPGICGEVKMSNGDPPFMLICVAEPGPLPGPFAYADPEHHHFWIRRYRLEQ